MGILMIPDPTAVFVGWFGCVESDETKVNRSDGGAVDGSRVEELPLSNQGIAKP